MDLLTHLFVGRLLAAGAGPEAVALGWLATAFAVLPDVDTVSWVVPRVRRWIRHRGVTHTLPFGVAASAVAGAGFALAGWSSFQAAFLVALAGFLSHVALDVLNWGAPVLWPYRRDRVEWTVHGGFKWSAAVSATGIVALAALDGVAPTLLAPAAFAMAAAFVLYLAVRAAFKLRVARRHRGRRVLPTGNPFVWRVP